MNDHTDELLNKLRVLELHDKLDHACKGYSIIEVIAAKLGLWITLLEVIPDSAERRLLIESYIDSVRDMIERWPVPEAEEDDDDEGV